LAPALAKVLYKDEQSADTHCPVFPCDPGASSSVCNEFWAGASTTRATRRRCDGGEGASFTSTVCDPLSRKAAASRAASERRSPICADEGIPELFGKVDGEDASMSHAATRARIIGDDEDPDECAADEGLGVVAADIIGKEYAKATGNPTADIEDGEQEVVGVSTVDNLMLLSVEQLTRNAGNVRRRRVYIYVRFANSGFFAI
jgi:hypothetical protein